MQTIPKEKCPLDCLEAGTFLHILLLLDSLPKLRSGGRLSPLPLTHSNWLFFRCTVEYIRSSRTSPCGLATTPCLRFQGKRQCCPWRDDSEWAGCSTQFKCRRFWLPACGAPRDKLEAKGTASIGFAYKCPGCRTCWTPLGFWSSLSQGGQWQTALSQIQKHKRCVWCCRCCCVCWCCAVANSLSDAQLPYYNHPALNICSCRHLY